jgi:hypothetical protein
MADGADPQLAEFIAFDEFRAGLPAGRFRVVVDPRLARRYVAQRMLLLVIVMPIIGVGMALAVTGSTLAGAALVAAGIAINRLVLWQSPKILLHLASRDAAVYAHVTQQGIMEVRRA